MFDQLHSPAVEAAAAPVQQQGRKPRRGQQQAQQQQEAQAQQGTEPGMALEFGWMAVLWRRGIEHRNTSVCGPPSRLLLLPMLHAL